MDEEIINKPKDKDGFVMFDKLSGYFRALEDDKLDEYHNVREKRKKSRRKKIKMNNNNMGVSSVIGVILMVAITVATAVTVYIYVDKQVSININEDLFSGQVIDKFHSCYSNSLYYWFTIENTTLDRIKDIEVTQDVYHRYSIGNYYDINNIKGE